MEATAQPATATEEKVAKRVIVSEDLPLTVLTAVATTMVMTALHFDRSLLYVGVAVSPLVADVIKNAFRGLRKRWLILLSALLVLLGTAGRALAARLRARQDRAVGAHSMVATAVVSAALTVGLFTVWQLGNGNAMTFFGSAGSKDRTPPRLTVPAHLVFRALGPTAVTYRVSALDRTDGPVTPICAPRAGAVLPVGPTVVRCSATDSDGDRATKSFVVTVRRVPIVLDLPKAISVEADGPTGVKALYSVTATGVSGKPVAPSCTPPSGSVFPIGTTPVTCSAVDAAGHRARGRFSVLVRDDEAPVLGLPGDLSGATADKSGRPFVFAATAKDRVDGTLRPSCDPASGSVFPIGTTTVKCTATDSHGNVGTGSFTVTVGKPTADKTAPKLLLPAGIRREATSGKGAVVTYRAAARDDADGSVATSCIPASGATFPLGSTTVRCSTHDAAANLTRGAFVVTIVDTTPPALAPLPDLKAEASAPGGAPVGYTASATDSVDGVVTPRCAPLPGSIFAIGATQVACTVTDAHGNHASGGFTVTVSDTTPPVLKLPDDLTAEATSAGGASVKYTVTAADTVSGAVVPACSPPPGPFPFGRTAVACTATDAHGNHSSGSFNVTVADTTPPTLKLPGALAVEATSPAGASVAYTASAVDTVSGTLAPACTRQPGPFPFGPTDVTCTATDAHGNHSSGTFTVTVADTTPPTLKLPGTITAEATSRSGAAVTPSVSAIDAVSGAVNATCTPQLDVFPLGQTTVTCTAQDARGNRASGSFTVNVVDTTAPSLIIPRDFTIAAGFDSSRNAFGATLNFAPRATDNVDLKLPVSCSPASGTFIPVRRRSEPVAVRVECRAVDSHGNEGTGGFTVTITTG